MNALMEKQRQIILAVDTFVYRLYLHVCNEMVKTFFNVYNLRHVVKYIKSILVSHRHAYLFLIQSFF